MSDEPWRPLGVDTDEAVAEYDALREGIPSGMYTQFWEWVMRSLTWRKRITTRTGAAAYREHLLVEVAEQAAQMLDLPMDSVRTGDYDDDMTTAVKTLMGHRNPLAVADFLLAHSQEASGPSLEVMLLRSRSAWTVGERAGKPGLERRVTAAVGIEVEHLSRNAGTAGVKIVQAWEAVYGIDPNPSHAYALAVRAVEDAAIPVVIKNQDKPTLGKAIGQMAKEDWRLPFPDDRYAEPSGGLALALCRALWEGHHDRHGGTPGAPGSVTQAEAEAAVSVAVTLVHWFTAGMVSRH